MGHSLKQSLVLVMARVGCLHTSYDISYLGAIVLVVHVESIRIARNEKCRAGATRPVELNTC